MFVFPRAGGPACGRPPARPAGPTWSPAPPGLAGISAHHPAFLSLCPLGGPGFPPGPPLPFPATSQSWLALTTGSSLASAQTQAGACPSGRLSLNTGPPPATHPPGPGSRSSQSGPSLVPEPDGQAVYRIMHPPTPRPAPDPRRPCGAGILFGDLREKPPSAAHPPEQGQGLGGRTRSRSLSLRDLRPPVPPASDLRYSPVE